MNGDLEGIRELRAELHQLAGWLAGTPPAAEREEIKQRLIALFQRTDAAQAELAGLKDGIRELVDRYKRGAADDSRPGPPETAPRLRRDHLGASTYLDKGWSLIALGDAAGAIQALERALELAPDETQAKSLMGWALVLAERHDEALARFSEVLAVEPDNALARVNVGYICLKKRIFGEAIEHLSRVIRSAGDRKASLYAHYYLGLVYLEREMYQDAESFLRQAIAMGPGLVEAYHELGRVQWLAGRVEEARSTWRQGAEANRFAPGAKRCREMLDAVARGESVPRSSSGV